MQQKYIYDIVEVCNNMNKLVFPQNDKEIQAEAQATRTKKYFCIYCKKLFCKLVPHLQKVHNTELQVLDFSKLPKGK